MIYQVLARKWRPKKFSEIVGQEHIIQAIIQSFLLNKIHHAYILSGTRGSGKTTIARLFAKGLNCTNQKISTKIICCNQCKNCHDIESGCFIDLIEIDAASRTKVEDTREILDNIQYLPSQGRFKVYLIDEVHMLSRHSFNALLKTLEEPPVHVKFILITTEHQKLPDTILSRCMQFNFKPLDTSQIIKKLEHIFHQENIIIENISALESLAKASKGSMRDALNLSEQAIILGNNKITTNVINNMLGILNTEYPLCLIENLVNNDINQIMSQIDNYSILGINWDFVLIEMLAILQKIAISQFSSNFLNKKHENNMISNINKRIYKLSTQITPEDVQLYYQILILGRKELPYAPSHKMGMEITILRASIFKSELNTINNSNTPKFAHNTSKTQYITNNLNIKDKDNNYNNQNFNIKKKIKIFDNTNITYTNSKPTKFNSTRLITAESSIDNNNDDVINNSISTLLKAREKLLINQQHDVSYITENISNDNHKFQKKTQNILKKISNISNSTTKDHNDRLNNKYQYLLNHLIHFNDNNIDKISSHINRNPNIPNIIQLILQEAIQNNPWIKQIYQLSLSKPEKNLIMHTWKEEISFNEIYLHLHSDYQYLNSEVLKNLIQKAFSKYMKLPITLHIKENDSLLKQTPIEYIYTLYKKKISQIKIKCSNDPKIKIISKFFDAKFDENTIFE